jgi:hypothetical protein
VDAYGVTLDQAWAMLAGTQPRPPAVGIVASPSGGWHFYFRLPSHIKGDSLPTQWNFGNGRQGDIRASREAIGVLVLPGSVCTNKHGTLGRYLCDPESADLTNPEALAPLPDTLLAQLLGRARAEPKAAPDGAALPTETTRLLSLLGNIEAIAPGTQNEAVAWVGMIAGRIGPHDRATPALVSAAWEVLRERLPAAPGAAPWTFTEFEKAVASGYKTGRRNAKDHTPAAEVPGRDDILAECEAIFGAMPWLIEVEDSQGDFVEYILGVGGAPDERDRATNILRVRSLGQDIISTLMRLVPGADHNAVLKSPLHVQPRWRMALETLLKAGRTVERVGDEPTERFWRILDEWVRAAASDGLFLRTHNDAWKHLESDFWIVHSSSDVDLVLLRPQQERLYKRVGSNVTTKKLLREHALEKGLRSVGKVLCLPVSALGPDTLAVVQHDFEKFLAHQRNQPNTNETHP